MAEEKHYETAPEDRISLFHKVIYGLGALGNQLLPAGIGVMSIVLNLGLKMNPALIGTILAIPRLFDTIIDPIMGYVTDITKSKWGRRKPYIFIGAILAGITFALMWQLPVGHTQSFYAVFFTIGSIIFYGAYTIFAAPYIALGYEMTPDYHERTSLMGFANSIGTLTWVIAPWFWFLMDNKNLFPDSVSGARTLAIFVGVSFTIVGILPSIFIKERYYAIAEGEIKGAAKPGFQEVVKKFGGFFKGIFVTFKNVEFLKLCLATILVFNGFMMISGLGSYVIIYYVFGGLSQGIGTLSSGLFIGLFGSISALTTSFVAVPLTIWISGKLGKRAAFNISMLVAIVGYILKWFCYKPGSPWIILIAAPFVAFSLGSLFTLIPSMMADLCDWDELKYGQRREGMFSAVYWWTVKMGLTLALFLSGFLLNWTGFDVGLGTVQPERTLFLMRVLEIGVSILTMVLAVVVISSYKVTEAKAREVRLELEKRRGKAVA